VENTIKYTIIICGYNIENYIETAINSVLEQDYLNYEIIVVNDGSTDKSLEKIQKYKSNKVIIVDNECNKGLGASRNIAVGLASV